MENPATISNDSARAGIDRIQSGPRRPGEGEFNFAARVQTDAAGPRDAIFLVFDARDARSESGPRNRLGPAVVDFERVGVVHEEHQIDVGILARVAARMRSGEREPSDRILAARPRGYQLDGRGRERILGGVRTSDFGHPFFNLPESSKLPA